MIVGVFFWSCGTAAALSFIGLPPGSPINRAKGLDPKASTFSSTSVVELIANSLQRASAPTFSWIRGSLPLSALRFGYGDLSPDMDCVSSRNCISLRYNFCGGWHNVKLLSSGECRIIALALCLQRNPRLLYLLSKRLRGISLNISKNRIISNIVWQSLTQSLRKTMTLKFSFEISIFCCNFAVAIHSGLRSVIDTFLLNQILAKFENGIRKWQQCSRQCISQNLYTAWVTVAYPFHRQSEKPDSGIS